MDRGAWQAIVHGVTRAGHDLVTKPPTTTTINNILLFDRMLLCDSLSVIYLVYVKGVHFNLFTLKCMFYIQCTGRITGRLPVTLLLYTQ